MPDFTLADQVLQGARHVFDRRARIDTVLVEQIDVAGFQADQRRFGDGVDVLRTAVGDARMIKVAPLFGLARLRRTRLFGGVAGLLANGGPCRCQSFGIVKRMVTSKAPGISYFKRNFEVVL